MSQANNNQENIFDDFDDESFDIDAITEQINAGGMPDFSVNGLTQASIAEYAATASQFDVNTATPRAQRSIGLGITIHDTPAQNTGLSSGLSDSDDEEPTYDLFQKNAFPKIGSGLGVPPAVSFTNIRIDAAVSAPPAATARSSVEADSLTSLQQQEDTQHEHAYPAPAPPPPHGPMRPRPRRLSAILAHHSARQHSAPRQQTPQPPRAAGQKRAHTSRDDEDGRGEQSDKRRREGGK
ncbi:hypothetical protein ACN47E_008192 [Coniothyrium glycines]